VAEPSHALRTPPHGRRSRWLLVGLVGCTPGPQPCNATSPPMATASEWVGRHAPSRIETSAPIAFVPGTWVLHVGDSFVDASFQQGLQPRFHAAGVRYIVRSETATYTTTWANSADFDALLSRKPSLVIVTLGANEFDIPFPELHARAIETIARKIARSRASCVWTAPPMWRGDTGISHVIHDHCAPCIFFDSDAVLGGLSPNERGKDHIHPNRRGGSRWADAFWQWLSEHRDPDRDHGPWALVPFERRGT
jgi:hypothetical protein